MTNDKSAIDIVNRRIVEQNNLISSPAAKAYQIRIAKEDIAELETIRTALTNSPRKLSEAPCDQCGYNGVGYYQPGTHKCAERHHALTMPSGEDVMEAIKELRKDISDVIHSSLVHVHKSTLETLIRAAQSNANAPEVVTEDECNTQIRKIYNGGDTIAGLIKKSYPRGVKIL